MIENDAGCAVKREVEPEMLSERLKIGTISEKPVKGMIERKREKGKKGW